MTTAYSNICAAQISSNPNYCLNSTAYMRPTVINAQSLTTLTHSDRLNEPHFTDKHKELIIVITRQQ